MNPNYLYVNTNYFTLGLKSIDVFIIALVEELQNEGRECCYTNEYFAHMLGTSVLVGLESPWRTKSIVTNAHAAKIAA